MRRVLPLDEFTNFSNGEAPPGVQAHITFRRFDSLG